ncbi:MAG: alkaline phosphatase family protein [Planctomycetota bacterium]|nr:MAG: alkaline phosphatase family protein [Planctomycetota bacterium]
MSPRVVRSVLAAFFCLSAGGIARADEVRHVVLVSIDGLRPEFYLDPRWPAPTLQRLAREGAHALAVRGVFPTVTYPSHVTLVTGARPGRHGVYSNTPFEEGGQTGRWFWEYEAIRVPTLFSALRDAGRETAAVSWPVTVGAPITRNFFPEIWSLDRAAPPLAATRSATTPGLVAEVERAATGVLDGRRWSMHNIGRDLLAGEAAAYLLERYRPALLAVHFVGVDHFAHEQGREGPKVSRAVATADSALTLLLEAAERAGIADRTAFVITGDHGFVDIHTQINPNVWLVQAGLQEARPDRGDWKAAFLTSGASALLRLRRPGDRQTLARVRRLLAGLPAGLRKSFRVLDRAALDACGADRDAPLALAAQPGYSFGRSNQGPALGPTPILGTHGYFPDFPEIHTGFVGWGPGFRPGAVAPQIGLEDVAPLVAKLLDLRFDAPDGVAPVGLLAPPPRIPRSARLY